MKLKATRNNNQIHYSGGLRGPTVKEKVDVFNSGLNFSVPCKHLWLNIILNESPVLYFTI